MTRSAKAALVVGILAVLAGGCGAGYDDDSYYNNSYYRDHSRYDRGDSWRDRDNSDRVRVCDSDGDDCHWEYRH